MRLKTVGYRFETELTVIAGGSGTVRGELLEPDQASVPSYSFVLPRLVLRSRLPNAIRPRMVLRAPSGEVYIVGRNGPSDQPEGTLWQSFRLFQATGQYLWQRREKQVDPVTLLTKDDGLEDISTIWCAFEPMDREISDYRMSASFEQDRFVTSEDVKHDDLLAGRKVTKADPMLGITVGFII